MLSLRDPVVSHNNNNNNGNSISHGNGNGASANNPTFPQFRIRTENNGVSHNGNGRVNADGNGSGNGHGRVNGRVKPEDLEAKSPVSSDHNNVKPSETVRLTRPSDLYVNGPGSGAGDYSFMSSCSLPSGQSNSPSTPEVVLRGQRGQSVTNNYTESGRHLNSALARHFRRLQCSSTEEVSRASQLSANLSSYLRDVFHQLDSGHTGSITR